MAMRCDIVSQDKSLFSGDVDALIAPSTIGEIGILPDHAPLLTTLDMGVLRVRMGDEEEAFTISGGVLEVSANIVTVLADVGERIDDIDLERAKAAKERAETMLREGVPIGTEAYLQIQAALRRSQLRMDAVRRYRRKKRMPAAMREES